MIHLKLDTPALEAENWSADLGGGGGGHFSVGGIIPSIAFLMIAISYSNEVLKCKTVESWSLEMSL